jgi:hypothetical protein
MDIGRQRIRRSDVVIVDCAPAPIRRRGRPKLPSLASGRSFNLVRGRTGAWARKPGGSFWGTMHPWTGENIRVMTTEKR